jgi:hypothetical protein
LGPRRAKDSPEMLLANGRTAMVSLLMRRSFAGLCFATALFVFFTSESLAQQTGSALRESLTFTAAGTGTITIQVAAGQGPGVITAMNLEFGPEGNAAADTSNPALALIFTVSTRINGVPVSRQFGADGGTEQQRFSGKVVTLIHGSATAPGYRLIVQHLTGVAAQETWTLDIASLPQAGTRVIAALDPTGGSTFAGLTPAAVCANAPGPLGTMFRQIATFSGSDGAQVAVSVGAQNAASTTAVWFEFGVDGSGMPNPVNLPAGATFAVSTVRNGNPASHTFFANGGDSGQDFGDVIVTLTPPQSAAPGLYVLTIVRQQPVPVTGETWTIAVGGMPAGLRGIITVPIGSGPTSAGALLSLAPNGACPAPVIAPGIAVAPDQVTAGDSPAVLAVTSTGGFDLNHLTTAHVSLDNTNGITNLAVSDTTATSLTLTFDSDRCAQMGPRKVLVNAHFTSLSAPFKVVHAPGQDTIAVSGVTVSNDGRNKVGIAGSSCVDLTGVSGNDISIVPPDDISNLSSVTQASPNNFEFSFDLAKCAPARARTLTVGGMSASFTPVAPGPGIDVNGAIVQRKPAVLSISAIGCVDLSQVILGQISITPNTGLGPLRLDSRGANGLQLSFDVASDAPTGGRTLAIATPNGTFSHALVVNAFRLCQPGFQCCEQDSDFGCQSCRRTCAVCGFGQHCCEFRDDDTCALCKPLSFHCPLPH